MAYNLILNVYRISLKVKGGKNTDLKNFSEFFEHAYKKDNKEENYLEFIKEFRSSFDDKFTLNSDKNKGISVTEDDEFTIRSEKNVIDGQISGGQTGIKQDLYKQSNSKKKEGDIKDDDVKAIPYFIKLWTPLDHDTGILMIQSYSNLTINNLIKSQFSSIFRSHKYSVIISSHIPQKVKDEFKKKSNVYKVAFVKESIQRSKRKLINDLFTDFEELKIRIEISGFKESAKGFWNKITKADKIIQSNLEDFDIKENEDFKTIAYYRDENGNESSTTLKKQLDITPTIFLSENLKQTNSERFDYTKIKDHTDSILKDIQIEIGYIK